MDTYIGMGYSNVIAYFIILATAVTLNAHGITNIQTATDAAKALRPVAATCRGAVHPRIVGTGLLAIRPWPARRPSRSPSRSAGTPAWSQARRRARLLRHHRHRHRRGVALSYSPLDPIKALFGAPWSTRHRRAADGGDHAAGHPQEPDGVFTAPVAAMGGWTATV